MSKPQHFGKITAFQVLGIEYKEMAKGYEILEKLVSPKSGKQKITTATNNTAFIIVKLYRAWNAIFNQESFSLDHSCFP